MPEFLQNTFAVYESEKVPLQLYERVKSEIQKLLAGQSLLYDFKSIGNGDYQIVVAGEKPLLNALGTRLVELLKLGKEEIREEKNVTEKTVPNVEGYQIEYLDLIGFAKTMAQKYKLKSIVGNPVDKEVTFRGSANSIQISLRVMYDLLLRLSQSKTNLDVKMVFQRVFQTPTAEKLIKEKLAARQISAVWCIEEAENILVYSESKDGCREAIDCINSVISSGLYPSNQGLDDSELKLLQSDMWRKKVQELKAMFDPFDVSVVQAQRCLSLAALSAAYDSVVKRISDFFAENVNRTTVFSGVPNRITFLKKFKSEVFRTLEKDCNVKIGEINADTGIELTGTVDNIVKCERRLKAEHDNVCREIHVIEHQALIRHITEEAGLINEVSVIVGCMVVPHKEEVISQFKSNVSNVTSRAESRYSVTLPSGTVCEVRKGDITTMTCDAIVNAANGRLQHMGGLAAAIVKRGQFQF